MPDPAADYLRSLNAADRVRAAAWDAVYAKDDADAQTRLTQLPFSDAVKMDLWDIRKGGTVTGAQDYKVPRAEDFIEPQTQPPQGSSLSRFTKGAAEYLNPVSIAQGLYQTVRHPIDTAGTALTQMGDQWSQARQLAGEGRMVEAGGHALAGSIPFVGPAAAQAGQHIADTGDVAGGLGQGVGLLAPALVAPAVRGGVRAATATARALPGVADAVAGSLERGAAARVTDVMAPKVGANKVRLGNQAAKVAPKIAEDLAADGAPMSRTGLARHFETRLAESEAALDTAADARNAGKPFDTQRIVAALKKKREALVAESFDGSQPTRTTTQRTSAIVDERGRPITVDEQRAAPIGKDVEPSPSAARIRAIDQVISEVEQLGPIAPFEALRRIRQSWDGVAKTKYAPSVTQDFLTKAGEASGAFDATGVLRDVMAAEEPATAAANAQYSLYRTANDVMKATEEVERTRPKVGRAIMARLTASLIGGQQAGVAGAVAGYAGGPLIDAAVNSGMTTQLQTAALMQRLAQVVRSGDVAAVDSVLGKLRALQVNARRGAVVEKATNPSGRQTDPAPAMP